MNKAELIKALAELLADKMEMGEEPTNGEMIQTLFPNSKVKIGNGYVDIDIDTITTFTPEWWNAPYQKGGE